MFAFLMCFHHHSVWWVFTAVSVGPPDEWSECLGFRRWGTLGAPENPVPSPGSSQKWYNLTVVPCRVLLALCPAQVPPKSQCSFQELREGFEIEGNCMETFEFPKLHSSALSLHLPFLLTDETPETQE